jgi:hypothetical protein
VSRWNFEVTGYYKSGGKAFIVTHVHEWFAKMEADAARSREDIGRVEVRDLRLTDTSKLP